MAALKILRISLFLCFILFLIEYLLIRFKCLLKLKNIFNLVARLNSLFIFQTNLWVEGLLFDFLQKKCMVIFIKKWIIHATYLWNERVITTTIIFSPIQTLIQISHFTTITEITSLRLIIHLIMSLLFLVFYLVYSLDIFLAILFTL